MEEAIEQTLAVGTHENRMEANRHVNFDALRQHKKRAHVNPRDRAHDRPILQNLTHMTWHRQSIAWILVGVPVIVIPATFAIDAPTIQDGAQEKIYQRGRPIMNRNLTYLVIGALAIGAGVMGYLYYKERQTASGIDINVKKDGISIETK